MPATGIDLMFMTVILVCSLVGIAIFIEEKLDEIMKEIRRAGKGEDNG